MCHTGSYQVFIRRFQYLQRSHKFFTLSRRILITSRQIGTTLGVLDRVFYPVRKSRQVDIVDVVDAFQSGWHQSSLVRPDVAIIWSWKHVSWSKRATGEYGTYSCRLCQRRRKLCTQVSPAVVAIGLLQTHSSSSPSRSTDQP